MSNSPTSNNVIFAVVAVAVVAASALSLAAFGYPALTSPNGHLALAQLEAAVLPHNLQAANTVIRAQLEVGEMQAAVTEAQRTLEHNPGDRQSTLLLGCAYALAGANSKLAALAGSVTDGEARSGLTALGESKLAQAQELYALGLLRSSQRVLAGNDDGSAQYAILRSTVELALHDDRQGKAAALPYAKLAVARDPSSKTAQALYISVSRKN